MIRLLILLCGVVTFNAFAQTTAQRRAARLGLGMNLSYLEGYWGGTKARHFSDFTKLSDVQPRKPKLEAIARAGFKTVRIPVCFGAWATINPPYRWDAPEMLAAPDSLVKWALANNLNVLIDLHHVEFDKSIPGADTTGRVVWLWQQIAERYQNTDPERVLFELRNEPNGMPAQTWRTQAEALVRTVRGIAPNHTLVVGFHDWNSRDAMIQSEPFADPNILYTFHFYDPFVFTHQGATWAGPGISELKSVPFPANPNQTLFVPPSVRGTWIENALNGYKNEATYEVIFNRLQAAKTWATTKNVPIFLGEFGSYNLNAEADSRCRHAEAIYYALGKLQIPSAWWEWDGGFTMYEKGTTYLMPCMREAIETYSTGQLKVLSTEPAKGGAFRAYPNPTRDGIRLDAGGATIESVRVADEAGRQQPVPTTTTDNVPMGQLTAGLYMVTAYDRLGTLLGAVRVVKE